MSKKEDKREEEEGTIKKLQKDVKRIKRLRYLKMLLTLLLISGVVVDLAYTYAVSKDLQITDKRITAITPEGGTVFKAVLQFTFENPRSKELELQGITYKIYVEGEYLGEGEKGAFTIPPGESNQSFEILFDLQDLGSVLDSVLGKEVVHLRLKGEVMVPAKFAGLYTWKVLTIPYDVTETFSTTGGEGEITPVVLEVPFEVTHNSVTLRWSRYIGEDFARYEVHFSTQKNFQISSNTLAGVIEDQDTTEYTVENLQPRTTYYFKIRVYNVAGLHADSNEVSATTRIVPIP
ncbi:MAG: hypothetical protein DRO01_05215 [Thermoproteota archaeon]|nr:MAG: hypothetical protein DRO01_05215 [Candidatus Korarchaeota archaeon]